MSTVNRIAVSICLVLPSLLTEYKRSRQEIKRKSLDTIKLQKKARKGKKNFYINMLFSEPSHRLIEIEKMMQSAWLRFD